MKREIRSSFTSDFGPASPLSAIGNRQWLAHVQPHNRQTANVKREIRYGLAPDFGQASYPAIGSRQWLAHVQPHNRQTANVKREITCDLACDFGPASLLSAIGNLCYLAPNLKHASPANGKPETWNLKPETCAAPFQSQAFLCKQIQLRIPQISGLQPENQEFGNRTALIINYLISIPRWEKVYFRLEMTDFYLEIPIFYLEIGSRCWETGPRYQELWIFR
jgi:hypothetical protein